MRSAPSNWWLRDIALPQAWQIRETTCITPEHSSYSLVQYQKKDEEISKILKMLSTFVESIASNFADASSATIDRNRSTLGPSTWLFCLLRRNQRKPLLKHREWRGQSKMMRRYHSACPIRSNFFVKDISRVQMKSTVMIDLFFLWR